VAPVSVELVARRGVFLPQSIDIRSVLFVEPPEDLLLGVLLDQLVGLLRGEVHAPGPAQDFLAFRKPLFPGREIFGHETIFFLPVGVTPVHFFGGADHHNGSESELFPRPCLETGTQFFRGDLDLDRVQESPIHDRSNEVPADQRFLYGGFELPPQSEEFLCQTGWDVVIAYIERLGQKGRQGCLKVRGGDEGPMLKNQLDGHGYDVRVEQGGPVRFRLVWFPHERLDRFPLSCLLHQGDALSHDSVGEVEVLEHLPDVVGRQLSPVHGEHELVGGGLMGKGTRGRTEVILEVDHGLGVGEVDLSGRGQVNEDLFEAGGQIRLLPEHLDLLGEQRLQGLLVSTVKGFQAPILHSSPEPFHHLLQGQPLQDVHRRAVVVRLEVTLLCGRFERGEQHLRVDPGGVDAPVVPHCGSGDAPEVDGEGPEDSLVGYALLGVEQQPSSQLQRIFHIDFFLVIFRRVDASGDGQDAAGLVFVDQRHRTQEVVFLVGGVERFQLPAQAGRCRHAACEEVAA